MSDTIGPSPNFDMKRNLYVALCVPNIIICQEQRDVVKQVLLKDKTFMLNACVEVTNRSW